MKFVLVSLLMMLSCLASAQEITNSRDSKGFRCSTIVVEGDTIPVMYYDEVRIWGERSYRNPAESRQWERLVRNVKKAYPYAKLAGIKFNKYSQKIADVKSEKVKKTMMKQAEDEIEAQCGK